ncbi:Ribosome-releasing factor [Hartmannibacter diazotrophicus]|uniref:Ribosome-recycling factor n=1 Tax=Hartmannibacter diazotrophicus TaxID=1482074 RepID=A0A2C9D448_9HYPH|nr:ribosome recycling factor [Hartmannibacter diazotrophicus]SON54938.1 Ribosome-releasing factor [Hartmannibacter diazotrophicus]
MSDAGFEIEDLKRRMQSTLSVFKTELSGLRTGRASASLLEPIVVEAWGQTMPINQVATVSVPESRMLSVQVWDKQMVGAVERAIRESNLGLNPVTDGTLLRLPIPELNTDRRKELVKIAHKYAEAAKVAIRHVRRDGMDTLKKLEKESEISEDASRQQSDRVQKLTDESIVEVDKMLAAKEQEIMQV